MSPSLSIIVCSLNGSQGLHRCLRALNGQTIRPSLEVIVVDDGSSDSVSKVAREHKTVVIRHEITLGISSARNSGIRVATGPIVAFLDDDCEPEPEWAEQVVSSFGPEEIAIGGRLLVCQGKSITLKYLARHNPLNPQESDLAKSEILVYRLYLYMRRQWIPGRYVGRRCVFALASANMSVRRCALVAIGGFDERIRFGSEDEDLCRRLALAYPTQQLIFDPAIRVVHHFKPSLLDMMRRNRAYGRGSALMYRKWPNVRPTFYPFPVLLLSLLALSFVFPLLLVAAVLTPHLLYPKGLRATIADRDVLCLLDPYLQMIQEFSDAFGFIEGLWKFRNFPLEHFTYETSLGHCASRGGAST